MKILSCTVILTQIIVGPGSAASWLQTSPPGTPDRGWPWSVLVPSFGVGLAGYTLRWLLYPGQRLRATDILISLLPNLERDCSSVGNHLPASEGFSPPGSHCLYFAGHQGGRWAESEWKRGYQDCKGNLGRKSRGENITADQCLK